MAQQGMAHELVRHHSGMCRYKQRGQAAEAADNVFHHLTYEGAVDVEHMTDKHQRAALESQINEFGQCPRQDFGILQHKIPSWHRPVCAVSCLQQK